MLLSVKYSGRQSARYFHSNIETSSVVKKKYRILTLTYHASRVFTVSYMGLSNQKYRTGKSQHGTVGRNIKCGS